MQGTHANSPDDLNVHIFPVTGFACMKIFIMLLNNYISGTAIFPGGGRFCPNYQPVIRF